MAWSACGHAARLAAIRTKPDRFSVLLQTAHDYPTAVSCNRYFSSSRMHAAIMPRDFALPTLSVGYTRLSAVRLIAKYADMFPLVSDYPHICFLLDLLQLLLSRSAHGHAVRLKIPVLLRTARLPTIMLPSRGFSCCCTCQLPQGYHPPCVKLRLHRRKGSDDGGTTALPAARLVGGD